MALLSCQTRHVDQVSMMSEARTVRTDRDKADDGGRRCCFPFGITVEPEGSGPATKALRSYRGEQ